MDSASIVRKLVVRTLIWLGITCALLFVSAGTLALPPAWVCRSRFAVVGIASGAILARSDPDLVRERMAPPIQKAQKGWDKAVIIILFTLWMTQYIVAGLDAVRFGTSHMPVWLNVVG